MSRLRRWTRRVGLGLLVLIVIVVGAATIILRGLDKPWVKRRVQKIARESSGLDIDYRATRVAVFSGLHIEDLIVRTPESLRGFAPELIKIGKIETGWSRGSLFGSGPTLNALVLDTVDITIVADEKGRTSISEIPPAKPAAKPSGLATPMSRVLADALGSAPAVARITVGKLSLKLIRVAKGSEVERITVGPLGLTANAEPKGPAWKMTAAMGSKATPIEISVSRTRGGEAQARLWLDASVAGDEALTRIDLEVVKQTLAPALELHRLMHVEAAARFDPKSRSTEVTVKGTEAADGAVTAEAVIVLPDGDAPVIKQATGTLDLVHLLELVPDGLLPVAVRAEKATARYLIQGLVLERVPRVLEGGSASAQGQIAGFKLGTGNLEVAVDQGRFSADARRRKDGVTAFKVSLPVHDGKAAIGAHRISGGELEVTAEARVDEASAWDGAATIAFGSLSYGGRSMPEKIDARSGKLRVEASALEVGSTLEIGGQIGALRFARHALDVSGEGIGISARAKVIGLPPYAIDVTLPLQKLRLVDGKQRLLDGRAKVTAHASQIEIEGARSRATAEIGVELDGLTSKILATKRADDVDFDLSANATHLAALKALVPLDAPWDRIGLALTSKGSVARLASGSPLIKHHTELRLDRPVLAGISASTLQLVADTTGTVRSHTGTLDLRARALGVRGATLGDSHLTLALGFDAAAPSIKVDLTAEGDGPTGKVMTALRFDRAKREIAYDVDAHLGHLAALAPLAATSRGLAGFDLARLELVVKGKGVVRGVIDSVRADGVPIAARHPLRTAAADGNIEVRALGFHWSRGDRDLKAPLIGWRGDLRTDGDKRLLHGELRLDALHIIAGEHHIHLERASDSLDVLVKGDLSAGGGTLVQSLKLEALRQDVAPQYPLGDLTWTLVAHRNTDGVINIEKLRLDNVAGGTSFSLKRGGFDFADERRSMSVTGVITQDLAKPWSVREVYQGRGEAEASLSITSANFSMFRARASLKVKNGWLKLPKAGVEVEDFDGEIPISADLVFDKRGPKLLRDTDAQPYAQLRFADQHPMMSRKSFISVRRISTPFLIAGPLGGNLKIEHNIVSLNQIEMGVRNGRLTGQAVLDWGGDNSTLQLHLRASKIEATKGEPFDGNAAVVFALRDRSLEGRAEILRIGRQHLLDLLDLHDPHRGDVSVNRIRRGLALGYPDRVRLAFDHGFARVKVTLGGVGALLRIDELRGIPMGPIIDKALAKLSRAPEEPVE